MWRSAAPGMLRHDALGSEESSIFHTLLPSHPSLHDLHLLVSILGSVLLSKYVNTMRLLSIKGDGSFSLTRFLPTEIPPYAILSHTWETDNQELTFHDMMNGTGRNKNGYRKIQFCGDQAKKDGVQYFWVDSVCIDKSSSAELSEAINSMFRWYRNAIKCYVYLSDVSATTCDDFALSRSDSCLSKSRWFTRGWTLQELLAPLSVEFYSLEGSPLGDKKKLEVQIHEITGIAVEALYGRPLSEFSVDERRSWAANRKTTIEEDQAYCLLGIFDAHLPLIYGEGVKNAFNRLQDEIDKRSSTRPGRGIFALHILENSVANLQVDHTYGGGNREMRHDTNAREEKVSAFLQLLYENACSYKDSKDRNRELVQGTCEWFTNHSLFRQWNSPSDSQGPGLLFVTADPGCGKSVLSRYLIDSILPDHRKRAICYFFFKDDFEDQKRSQRAICTLLHQLFDSNRLLLTDTILEKYKARGAKLVESFSEMWNIFLATAVNQETVCVIDALDECQDEDRKQFIDAVTKIYGNGLTKSALKFLLTSRPYNDVRSMIFQTLGPRMASIHLQGDCGPTANEIEGEIRLVVDSRIHETADFFCLEPNERQLMKERLECVPNRTYLWISLIFDGLMDRKLGIDKNDILNLARTLPQSVNDAYEKILNRGANQEMTRKALRIILGAKRPLNLSEMSLALALKGSQQSCDYTANSIVPESRFRDHLRNLCGLFVTVVDNKVYLLHQTAREFLIHHDAEDATEELAALKYDGDLHKQEDEAKVYSWRHSLSPTDVDSTLAEICIWYLHLDLAKQNPSLLEYSARFWARHYRYSKEHLQTAMAEITQSLCLPSPARSQWTGIHNNSYSIPVTGSPLCLASALGLEKAVKLFLSGQDSVENQLQLKYSRDQTSLSRVKQLFGAGKIKLGSKYRRVETPMPRVKLPLTIVQAEVDSKDSIYEQTPLSWAAENGHEAVVKLLLETGMADVDTKDGDGWTPLLRAAQNGHVAVAKLLLETGKADANKKDGNGWTPLSNAAWNGDKAVVKLLLETGKADANTKDSDGWTPLLKAAENGHVAVVRLLLETGKSDVNTKDNDGWTPLLSAAQNGHVAVVKLLLETGKAGVNTKDNDGWTPLLNAAENGHEAVVRLLLETGKAGVNTKDNDGWTPLLNAAENGHEAVVRLLLETGKADVNAKSNDGWTPLLYAAENGHEAVVRLLLQTGKADVNMKSNNGRTPLFYAAENGHEAVVRLLLETGKADVDTKDSKSWTPLLYATKNGHKAVVKLLQSARSL